MMKKILCVMLSVFVLTCCACAGDLSAGSAILIDADSGEALFEKKPDERRLIASTTKIMTALVVLENCGLDEKVVVPKECERVGGSSMYLRAGDDVTVRDLLYGLLLMSGNDAGLALACHCGKGSVDEFVMMMNLYAQDLGLADTSFENPHGLDGEQNYSTARDMAALAAHAMRNAVFAEIVSTKDINLSGRFMHNHNKLLWRLDGACGVKTGFTKAAGRCLVSCAEHHGRRFIAVTLSAPDDWNDHEKLYRAVFDALEEHVLVKAGERAAMVPSVTGNDAEVVYDGDFSMWMTPYEYETAEIRLNLPSFLYGGRMRGERAGSAEIYVRGVKAGSVALSYK